MNRNRLVLGLLLLSLIVLIIEMIWLAPVTLQRWHPYDYSVYGSMGMLVRQGQSPYQVANYWILPAILWVCVPLSLMPNWFVLIWVLIPMALLLVIHKRDGLWLLLFTPLWLATADAMLDGLLLLPVYWLLQDKPTWAGIGGVILMIKPQLAILPVAGRAWEWLWRRNWRQLWPFLLASLLFVVPSFIVQPDWPLAWLKVLPLRAAETTTILPRMTASVWSWWALGWGGKLAAVLLLALSAWLFRQAWRAGNRIPALFLAGIFLMPILFASSLIVTAAALRGRRQIELATALSLAAFLVDRWFNPFAGVFALIPLLILWFYRQPLDSSDS